MSLSGLCKLGLAQLVVGALFGHKLCRGTRLYNATLVNYKNAVGILNCRKTVGNYKACAALEHGGNSGLYEELGLGVYTGVSSI